MLNSQNHGTNAAMCWPSEKPARMPLWFGLVFIRPFHNCKLPCEAILKWGLLTNRDSCGAGLKHTWPLWHSLDGSTQTPSNKFSHASR